MDENESTEKDIELIIISFTRKSRKWDEPVEPLSFLKVVNESFAIICRRFEACGGNYNLHYKLEKNSRNVQHPWTKQWSITIFFQSSNMYINLNFTLLLNNNTKGL